MVNYLYYITRKNLMKKEPLLMIAFVVISVYSSFLYLAPSTNGMPEAEKSIFQLISYANNHPGGFQVVLGWNSEDYEREYGKKIADHFGIPLRREENVRSRDKLLLIGNPNNNLIIDKMIGEAYDGRESKVISSGDNILLVVSNEKQMKEIYGLLTRFRQEHKRFSVSRATIRVIDFLAYAVIIVIVAVSLLFLAIESYRKKIDRQEHFAIRLKKLEKYIKKYEDEGRRPEDMKDWLIKQGFSDELVSKAIKDVK